jgi:uncharacterized phage-like protein YoqJ
MLDSNSLRMHNSPPSIDCLIIVQCDTNPCYDFYLVELKNIKSTKGFDISNLKDKFTTVIEDFLKTRLGYIFLNPEYGINEFKLSCHRYLKSKKRFPDIIFDNIKTTYLEPNTKLYP